MSQSSPCRFNGPQASRILACFSNIDKLSLNIEEILSASSSDAFPKYLDPLTPAQIRIVQDYLRRIRGQLLHVLQTANIPIPSAKFDTVHSIRVHLQFIEVAIEELDPHRLQGYGELPPDLQHALAGGLQETKGIVRQLDSYLRQRSLPDLSARLSHLSDVSLGSFLSSLNDIINRHHLIEFRSELSRLILKIEDPSCEIAFFGRVSSGKSSLLNRLINADLLPTGVTPVTAIPTRIRNRAPSALIVSTADGRIDQSPVSWVADFVTEEHNPANTKRITRLMIHIPVPALPAEVTLVDTPGLDLWPLLVRQRLCPICRIATLASS